MRHEDYKEMLVGDALSALDADEAGALEMHLQECLACRAELSEWQETTGWISLSAGPLEPSPQVRDRIMGALPAEGATEIRKNFSASTSSGLPFEVRRKNVWTSLGSFGAIAAMLVMVAVLAGLFTLWQQNRTSRAELARLQNQMRETNQQLANERALVALVGTPGARMTELAGTNVAPGAHAMLAYDKTGHAMLMTKNLPAAPPGKAYQLWFIKDNRKMPGKTFTTDDRGNGMLEDQIPVSAMGSAIYAITLEPAPGVQVPTGSVYLVSGS